MNVLKKLASPDNDARNRFALLADNEYGWTYSNLLPDAKESAKAIIYHEYGHVIHLIDKRIGPRIDDFIKAENPRGGGWHFLLSEYAGTNDKEYVAEALSLYMHAPTSQRYRIHPKLLDIFKSEDLGP
ncbi:MAG: hypothetical protein U5N55_01555 [Cypionkella sp.]|nr:hypothetical protein [Cypionkella sp.]